MPGNRGTRAAQTPIGHESMAHGAPSLVSEDRMSAKTIMKFTAPFFVVALAPFSALADDQGAAAAAGTDLTQAQQDCVNKCLSEDGSTASAQPLPADEASVPSADAEMQPTASTPAPKKAKKTAAASVTVDEPVAPDQATIDSIRAEERARAAEEFNAGQQQAMQMHEQELEHARAEERAKAEAEAQQKLSNERMRYEQALATERESKSEKIADALITPAGIYGFLGGGVSNFTQSTAADVTEVGGYWDARVGIGTRSIIGGEVAYVGSARDIVATGLNSDAFLVSNGLEGIARLNVPITPEDTTILIEPYTFAGLGWNRFDISSDSPNTSSFADEDNVLSVPLGVGLSVGFSGVTLDARATYRQAVGSDLLASSDSSFDDTALNSWGLGAALGFEF
ncbi:MAG: hypothetical protein Q8O67_13715 [Deltaproteobacteria bacterium]|nr:hypothetical protein [Deltaproteobacteria bacterium]